MKLLIINPGATSTKIAVFEDEEQLFKVTIDHSAEELDQFPRVIDQADYRKEAILKAIGEAGYQLGDFAAVCGRGGLYRPIPSGTYAVNDKVIADADILYMTRVQKERFSDLMEYERVKNVYILKRAMLKNAKENMKIMHPLPRVNEIAYDVDDDPHAYYIQQAQNGLYAREAIFCHVLGITLDDIRNDKTIIER